MTEARWPHLDAALDDSSSSLSKEARVFVDAIVEQADLPERLARMALLFRSRGSKRDAMLLARAAIRLAPDDYRIKTFTHWLVRREAPVWHFPMIHDGLRNQAYAKAIAHWVKPGMTVFEIGAGTGILAMLAIRAGAAHVYTCERRTDVAAAARDIIQLNGMADRITVIAKDARTLVMGEDIPHLADLFVAEVLGDGLLDEHVLPLTRLARERFLTTEAILLPGVVSAEGYLVSGHGQHQSYRMSSALGFDLTPFNRFSPLQISTEVGGGHVEPLSEAMELIAFDLREDAPQEGRRRVQMMATQEGVAEGVMRWLKLDFGGGVLFENKPPQPSAWRPQIHLLPAPRPVAPGDAIDVEILHTHDRLFVMGLNS